MDGCKLSLPFTGVREGGTASWLPLNTSLLSFFFFFFFFKAAEFLKCLKSWKVTAMFTQRVNFRVLFRADLRQCSG